MQPEVGQIQADANDQYETIYDVHDKDIVSKHGSGRGKPPVDIVPTVLAAAGPLL